MSGNALVRTKAMSNCRHFLAARCMMLGRAPPRCGTRAPQTLQARNWTGHSPTDTTIAPLFLAAGKLNSTTGLPPPDYWAAGFVLAGRLLYTDTP